jgi:hypothetical protein
MLIVLPENANISARNAQKKMISPALLTIGFPARTHIRRPMIAKMRGMTAMIMALCHPRTAPAAVYRPGHDRFSREAD